MYKNICVALQGRKKKNFIHPILWHEENQKQETLVIKTWYFGREWRILSMMNRYFLQTRNKLTGHAAFLSVNFILTSFCNRIYDSIEVGLKSTLKQLRFEVFPHSFKIAFRYLIQNGHLVTIKMINFMERGEGEEEEKTPQNWDEFINWRES